MPENVIICSPEIGDEGNVLESSASASSMPASNLFDTEPTVRWRSTALAPAYVEIDLGQQYSMNLVALLFTNASNTGTYRVRMATSKANLTSSPGYDSGNVDVWMNKASVDYSSWLRVHTYLDLRSHTPTVGSAGDQLFQYVRIDVNDAANADGYIDVGRLYLSYLFQPTFNMTYGSGVPTPSEDVIRIESEGGLEHSVPRPKKKKFRLTLQFTSEQELMEGIWEILRRRGSSGDVLVIPFPDSTWKHHTIMYSLMSAGPQIVIPSWSTYEATVDFEEKL